MKFITILLNLFVIMFFFTGCVPNTNWVWYKAGGSQEELAKDNYHCLLNAQQKKYIAQGSIPAEYNWNKNYSPAYANKEMVTNPIIFDACMNAHGWYKREILSPQM